MKTLGICLGASTVTLVQLSKNPELAIDRVLSHPHEGNPRRVVRDQLENIDLGDYSGVCVTGRKFRNFINLPSITEPEATELAYEFVRGNSPHSAIVSAGGETFIVYSLDDSGKISNVYSGNKCASGTGEFFLQQIRRMNLPLDEALALASKENPHRVSGRCSVFCKSDCTHALNKGIPTGNVTAGLCEMMAGKIIELLSRIPDKKVMVVGGTSQNKVVMDLLRKEVPEAEIPKEAAYFEALGAALWAMQNKALPVDRESLFREGKSSFSFLQPLRAYEQMVIFKRTRFGKAKKNDECIIGLDVGSTTTKAIILRLRDNAILASSYLRTNGNPVQASRECYSELQKQIKTDIRIIGLGSTGSGRHIAGLHALTKNIINEIIAHATAAVHFDQDVDTIFEIGGQDAKYTYIVNSVPSDYAMNEACSAGTGSFLEEAAKESLGIDVKQIAGIALRGSSPPNFNDQCAAFISSDIKTAANEGIPKEDIVAGLVYSICMNYNNRVRGNRPAGRKVFMQGGVCYNRAVPIAMAALTGKKIIVPPEPGLMGAFGVALELKNRIKLGLSEKQEFSLSELAKREVKYGKPFNCAGGSERCDRGCEIMMISIKNKMYPFGGACNKYYNLMHDIQYSSRKLNLVALRQELIFEKYASFRPTTYGKTIGMNLSFLANTFYPLFYNFFSKLGLQVLVPDKVLEEGTDKKGAAFCYPAEISHGLFLSLLKKRPDFLFVPLILEIPTPSKNLYKKTCVFIQGEHAYLRTAFKIPKKKMLSPVLNFSNGFIPEENKFVRLGEQLGFTKAGAKAAYGFAQKMQMQYQREAREIGRKALSSLESDRERTAVVLFGRPYNAYAGVANMGIPHKFATRGTEIIPLDFIPYENEPCNKKMYWGQGQINLMAAGFVKRHPQLYGAFVSNFSCGPDSFIISYFRDIMGVKPSLTLELDSHTADAGLNTRIEAFLDIVKSYRELEKHKQITEEKKEFVPARVRVRKGGSFVITSKGEKLPLTDRRVTMIVPSMGRLATEAFSDVLCGLGINTKALPIPDSNVLMVGRANTSCKECLPMQLTTGSLLEYVKHEKIEDEVVVYFLPEASGPCRFGQYNVFMRNLITKKQIKDVAFMSLTSEDSYAGLGNRFGLSAWKAVIISDVMTDILHTLMAIAEEKEQALEIFWHEWNKIRQCLSRNSSIFSQIAKTARAFSKINLKIPVEKANRIALVGEIYVRKDELSRQGLVGKLADRGYIVKVAPISEFVYYTNYILRNRLSKQSQDRRQRLESGLQLLAQYYYEKKIKKLFAKSGLYRLEMTDISKTVEHARHLIDHRFLGETILTTGMSLREVLSHTSGVISIGPFACMPSRVAEALLTEEMTLKGKAAASKDKAYLARYKGTGALPFLAIETDGNPYPQIIEARLETFCLQSKRIHEKMQGKHPARPSV